MSNTVMTVRCCQLHAQPLSSIVSHGNESYNTDNPSASLVTVISNYSQPCSFAMYTSHSYYSRVAFIWASNCAATIRGWQLFYLKKYNAYIQSVYNCFCAVGSFAINVIYVLGIHMCGVNLTHTRCIQRCYQRTRHTTYHHSCDGIVSSLLPFFTSGRNTLLTSLP